MTVYGSNGGEYIATARCFCAVGLETWVIPEAHFFYEYIIVVVKFLLRILRRDAVAGCSP